jgi:hypothetical protein
MAKHRHSRRHRRSHKRSHGVKRGGSGNYTSASTYGSYVNGSGDSQYSRVFDQSVDAGRQSNLLVGVQGQWAQQPHSPTAQNLSLVQSAGKRRNKSRRGGLFGEVVTQAVVPLALLGMQQTYRRKRTGGRKGTRKHR